MAAADLTEILCSELQPQSELQRSRRKGRRRFAEGSARQLRIEAVEVYAVQQIVKLRAELEAGSFASARDLVVLDHRKVDLRVPRSTKRIPSQVTLLA